MRIDVLTLFPSLIEGALGESIIARARGTGAVDLRIHDIRSWTHDVHRTADDTPYGGGAGMVMKVEPIVAGVEAIRTETGLTGRTFVMAASGPTFTQAVAIDLAREPSLLLICGHYEGIDHRVYAVTGAEPLSIGDFVLTGGELPAAVVIDAVVRLLPGVIKAESIAEESHSPETGGHLEYPQFTRPAVFRGLPVPDVLLSGNHARIRAWRREQAEETTRRYRPDLLGPDAD